MRGAGEGKERTGHVTVGTWCTPVSLLNSDSDRTVSIHEKENSFWEIRAQVTRQDPQCLGQGQEVRPAAWPSPACDTEGSELQDHRLGSSAHGEPGSGSSGLDQGPPDAHPAFPPRR